jgi:DNA-binding NtrC family response regulator
LADRFGGILSEVICMNRELFLTAVRALAAFAENASVPERQIVFLRNHAPAQDADQPIEELCCRIIQREITQSKPLHADALLQASKSAKPIPTEICETLEEVERAHIERIFQAAKNNISKAARILGIDRSTLYAKLKKYRIGDFGEHEKSGSI